MFHKDGITHQIYPHAAVPAQAVRAAAIEFAATAGSRPTSVFWEAESGQGGTR